MPQLVGRKCVRCGRVIDSDLEARFCTGCGNAVHDECLKPAEGEDEAGKCSLCGGDKANPQAKQVQFQRAQAVKTAARDPRPVSKGCPACGDVNYGCLRPNRWIAFIQDRVCLTCRTRYTPPTPKWAGMIFVLAGLALSGVGLIMALLTLLFGNVIGVCDMLIGVCLFVLGLAALGHGIRSLTTSQSDG